ncbi:putative bifunctional diguanylate cyclase/phosphodiesterase [Parahaliea mediterranea]|uniref:Bifunctional diguanylate cyclase/phosphodiesterase n=1 Tax=Parahaliea mediterranea TaxID=651086 RepID=A0A939IHM8_9GAMM|nr:bifunctional diguanylate cyclase/phosphodiesterase [Parahaliea mediterranea]MBN7795674.1 bifunctional diguanylate cyclase/phosphodiesterase [Parahaliea mediterranea]
MIWRRNPPGGRNDSKRQGIGDKALASTLPIVLAYGVLGAAWIALSDLALETFVGGDPERLSRLQSYKGWGFIAVTSILLFALAYRGFRRITRLQELDPQTNLLRHSLFSSHLDKTLQRSSREQFPVLVLYMDIDRFNDLAIEIGQPAADAFLSLLGDHLRNEHSADTLLSRLGFDEFGLAIPLREAAAGDSQQQAARLQRVFNEATRKAELELTCSIGAALSPDDGTRANQLVSAAGQALRAARLNGPARISYFNKALAKRERDKQALLSGLKQAIAHGGLSLVYQPQVRLSDLAITGCEVLVRWHCPIRGTVSPSRFIALAEQHLLIAPITELVMSTALKELQTANLLGSQLPRVSMNISALEFTARNFRHRMEELLKRHDALRPYLQLEITESAALEDVATTIAHISELRHSGVRFSIDDFGTGYSGLAMLRDLPVDELKIDRTFVADMESQERSAAIVRAITRLADNFDLTVVAEGVETASQLEQLRQSHCAEGQGWLFARPLPIAELVDFLRQHREQPPPTG